MKVVRKGEKNMLVKNIWGQAPCRLILNIYRRVAVRKRIEKII
jgi:hypothetical protein